VADLLGLGLSAKTAYVYGRILDRVAAELAPREVTILDCSAVDLVTILDEFRAGHSSRCQLRAALVAAWEILGRLDGPVKAIRIPPKPKTHCRALSLEAAQQLERAAWAREDDPGLAVLLGLYAGLRRAEIAGLRWEDVKPDEHGRPEWMRILGKGELVADVPVHPVLTLALSRRRRALGWVFEGRARARPAGPATIWAWVKLVGREAGLGEISPHVLRHTALAECNDRTGDLRTVQEIARHSRPETTSGYTRTTRARMLSVVSAIDYGRRLEASA
jgi:integrase